jgi:hypothetical protein
MAVHADQPDEVDRLSLPITLKADFDQATNAMHT